MPEELFTAAAGHQPQPQSRRIFGAHLLRKSAETFAGRILNWLARTGVSPNQITCMGLVLVTINSGLYLLHRDTLWFGVGLSFSFMTDYLDGALARQEGAVSRFGGYLDAVADRYQEIVAYCVIAWVNDYWAVVFFVVTGSLLTSYNKARTAIEIPIGNKGWPDLLERPQRLSLICLALIIDSFIPVSSGLGGRMLYLILIVLALFTHITAVQRFFRARRMLLASANGLQSRAP
jgi:phosphatidylglycerophosphate synthase